MAFSQCLRRYNISYASAPRPWFFNTFFYSQILRDGVQSVSRWTKKVDVFSHDLIIVPVNKDQHWFIVAVIQPARCVSVEEAPRAEIISLDLLGYKQEDARNLIVEWLRLEARTKYPIRAFRTPQSLSLKVCHFIRDIFNLIIFLGPFAIKSCRLWTVCHSQCWSTPPKL